MASLFLVPVCPSKQARTRPAPIHIHGNRTGIRNVAAPQFETHGATCGTLPVWCLFFGVAQRGQEWRQHPLEFVQPDRRTERLSLERIALELGQKIALSFGFHSLGNDREAHGLA